MTTGIRAVEKRAHCDPGIRTTDERVNAFFSSPRGTHSSFPYSHPPLLLLLSFPSQTEKWRGRERRKIPLFSPHRMLIGRGRSPLLLLLLLFSLLHGTASGAKREEGGDWGIAVSADIDSNLHPPPPFSEARERERNPCCPCRFQTQKKAIGSEERWNWRFFHS